MTKVICLLALFASVAEALGADKAGSDCTSPMSVHLKGNGKGATKKYLHSNIDEGSGYSWGSRNLQVGWDIVWEGTLTSGKEVHIISKSSGKYLHSNSPENGGFSWGSKGKADDIQSVKENDALNWKLYFEGDLKSGTEVFLYGKGIGQYFASNRAEGEGMSWGGRVPGSYSWKMEWDSTCSMKEAAPQAEAPKLEEAPELAPKLETRSDDDFVGGVTLGMGSSQADTEAFEGACDEQGRFDIMMCNSHMCTDCTLAWCTEKCQDTQLRFPTCRCEQWPAARKTYSSGEFKGKGKFGDAGDYASAPTAFLNLKTKSAHDRSRELLRK